MSPPSRRQVVGSATTTAVALLSGCLFGGRVSGGHIFLENRSEQPRRIALTVTETTDGAERLVHHVFEVPEETAIEFDDVLRTGRTYVIRAHQPDVPEAGVATLELRVDTCGQDDAAQKLDVSILATSDGPDLITYDCDEAYQKIDQLDYVERSEYQVGTVTGTVPTATES